MKKLLMLLALGSTTFAFAHWEPNQQCQQRGHSSQQSQHYGSAQQNRAGYDRNFSGDRNSRNFDNSQSGGYAQQRDYYQNDRRDSYKGYQNDQDDENDDDALTQSIKDSLASQGLQLLFIDVDSGTVTVDGNVDSDEKKANIERSLKNMDGVTDVQNNIKVVARTNGSNGNRSVSEANGNKSGYSDALLERSERKFPKDTAKSKEDRILNAKIRDKISSGWFSTVNETLLIQTDNGAVIITGTVEKPEDIKSLGDKINGVEGVKSLDNQLKAKNQ